jgi:hypothetical protein
MTERPKSLKEFVEGTDWRSLLIEVRSAQTLATQLKAQAVGFEGLYEKGLKGLTTAIAELESLEDYNPESAPTTRVFTLKVSGTKADVEQFAEQYLAAREKLEVEAIIDCAKAYGRTPSVCDSCGALDATSRHEEVIHVHFTTVDLAQALKDAGVNAVEDDVEMADTGAPASASEPVATET